MCLLQEFYGTQINTKNKMKISPNLTIQKEINDKTFSYIIPDIVTCVRINLKMFSLKQ